jgi:DNA processing protein
MGAAVASPVAEKYLRLHLCRDVGSIRFQNLVRELGGIDAVLGASVRTLIGVSQVGDKVAENVARGRDEANVARELELAARCGVRILCLADEDYPAGLRNIPDPPACLYVRGTLEREDAVALGVVGSRHCSRYGAEQAERLAALAASAGLTVVSGMARGIDTGAHRGALAGGGRTIAVIGCGLSHLYPPESTDLAAEIVARGALLSELPMDVPPDSKNFPPRNRIIAGLSLGVLVVEAGQRSGALITARLASEYNREVFALPGRIDSPYAEGCHQLIKSGAAKLVTRLEDILEELGAAGAALMSAGGDEKAEKAAADAGAPRPTLARLDEHETKVLAVVELESASVEEICDVSGLPPARVAVALTGLQLKGLLRRVGGDHYERTGS